MFQASVNRNYTTGFPGDVINDGPHRAKPGRILSATLGSDPGASTNRITRAFGFSAEMPVEGLTNAAEVAEVIVGGPNFFGVLFNRLRYILNGTPAGGPLASSLDLPQGADAEFTDMVTGLVAEIFNFTTGAVTPNYGDPIGYVPSTISTANNPLALPYGALVSWAAGTSMPTGLVAIPNARLILPTSLAASAVGALVSGYTKIQLTQ